MIAKVVQRDKSTSDFGRLGNYILEAKTDEAAILWTRTAEYVMDLQADGEKLAWFEISNCISETPAEAIAEILVTQSENVRSQADKTYHLVISFREGEQISREQMRDIEDSICTGLGFAGHQRLSAVHINTENTHLHIAINKIHPTNHRNVEPYYPYYKLDSLCKELEKKHGLERDNRIEDVRRADKASQMEAHSGEQSLLTWVKTNAKPALTSVVQQGSGWQKLHDVLGEHGLEAKLRGAGLVLATKDGQLAVKASSVDRSLSLKSLTDRFGPYEPNTVQHQNVESTAEYKRVSQRRFGDTNALYAAYQMERQTTLNIRSEFKAFQTQERQAFTDNIKRWYHDEKAKIKASSDNRQWKQERYRQLSRVKQERWQEFQAARNQARDTHYKAHPAHTWQQYLIKAAENGNTEALEALRLRKRKQERITKAILTASNPEQTKHIVFRDLKPYARKNGDLIYRIADGGLVTDEKHQVRVDEVTAGASFLALSLAAERFQGQALDVQGSDEFKSQVAQLAKQYDMSVQFKDPALERIRVVMPERVVPKVVEQDKGIER